MHEKNPIRDALNRALEIGKEMASLEGKAAHLRDDLAGIETRLVELKEEHTALSTALRYDDVADDDESEGTDTRQPSTETEPLVRRVVRFLGTVRGASADDVTTALDEDAQRVIYCLQDLRSKRKFLDKPKPGLWALNKAGRGYLEEISAPSTSEEEAPM